MTRATGDPLDVLVVGAGPTGLTLAAQLRAFGASVRIIDRQLDRVHESRALAVQPRTLEVLRGLGVSEELIKRGNDAVWVQLHAGGRVVRIRLFGLGLDDTPPTRSCCSSPNSPRRSRRLPRWWRRSGRTAALPRPLAPQHPVTTSLTWETHHGATTSPRRQPQQATSRGSQRLP